MAQLLTPISRVVQRGSDPAKNGSRELPGDASFKLASWITGLLAGALAGAIFNRMWQAVSGTDQAPEPTALDRKIGEVLLAGVLQGAVFGLVKAAIGRITAHGYRRFTGNDPMR